MLLNIHPAHRSSLKSWQLEKSDDVKHYGMDAFLKRTIDETKTLAKFTSSVSHFDATLYYNDCKQGFQFKHGSINKYFDVSLVFVVGDTPASGLIGGFKGVGGANRRTCMIMRTELCTKVCQQI